MLDVVIHDRSYERLAQIDARAERLRSFGPFSEAMQLSLASYDEDFLVRMAYNSNAIEGSALTLLETEIVYEGEFVPGKPGRDQIAARGIFEGYAFIRRALEDMRPLGEDFIKDLHERTALDLQPQARGCYRNAPALIRASRTVPVAALKIRPRMADLLYDLETYCQTHHPVVVAAWFHAAFERIHPFADGNGRTGRLLLNHTLERWGYPPIAIKVDRALEYRAALESWQVDGEQDPFVELVVTCLDEELSSRIAYVEQGVASERALTAAKKPAASDRKMQALESLLMRPDHTAQTLGGDLGVSPRQAQRLIRQLREEGLIVREGSNKRGRWVVCIGREGDVWVLLACGVSIGRLGGNGRLAYHTEGYV